MRSKYNVVFLVTVAWTLGLLWLGSVVHATGSSLACPDWPTCFGSMTPEMVGGVFWEHLHRIVAGALIVLFGTGAALAWRAEADRPWVRGALLGGVALLLVQSVLGGLTVIFRLPDAISTAHLTLAFLFLALATVLALVTGPAWGRAPGAGTDLYAGTEPRGTLRTAAPWLAVGVLAQSVLGAAVRHTDAGMACGTDLLLCAGRWAPDPEGGLALLHVAHRGLGYLLTGAVTGLAWVVLGRSSSRRVRGLALAAAALVLVQVALGLASVHTVLGVLPVSLHTLGAASLLAVLVALSALGVEPRKAVAGPAPELAPGPAVPEARGH